jgi:cellulose synthase/poly-beta-1,6-N-acetylglucosamine synthase-like glycosyltransferase
MFSPTDWCAKIARVAFIANTCMLALFWVSLIGTTYAYFGYPVVLWVIARCAAFGRPTASSHGNGRLPSNTLLVPVHNESRVIVRKLDNTLALEYPGDLEVIVVSDGSTDETVSLLKSFPDRRLRVIELMERRGKAQALNAGLELAKGEIVTFSDASIMLDKRAMIEIVRPFSDPSIGCVSGEDRIEGGGGEGLYGRYELFLRKLESEVGSIVGASGSFYAQRRVLVSRFDEGQAPDFLSVLGTIEKGYRAISVPSAIGYMSALSSTQQEFRRKIRTIVRGMSALFSRKRMLNPLKYPMFSFCLLSHKLLRWCVPLFLVGMLVSTVTFASSSSFFLIVLAGQTAFYLVATLAYLRVEPLSETAIGRICLYFVAVNMAILVSWIYYLSGFRQELWAPSSRAT